MKKTLWGLGLVFALCLWLIPSNVDAFTLNASNFAGYAAWDSDGDVIGKFGLDPRFSYPATGEYFNVTAGLMFDFEYIPSYPTYQDIIENPNTDWMWTFSASNICVPCEETPLPEFVFSRRGSYADILAGVNWAEENFGEFIPEDLHFVFDYDMTSPTTGVGYIAMAGNAPLNQLPSEIPSEGLAVFDCDADISVTAEPVPEPFSLLLFGTGMAGVAIVRRFKK